MIVYIVMIEYLYNKNRQINLRGKRFGSCGGRYVFGVKEKLCR